MSKICLVCNVLHLDMIRISHYPQRLDSMLKCLLELEAKPNDYLCKTCCWDVINAFNSKEKPDQFNPHQSKELRNYGPLVNNHPDSVNQAEIPALNASEVQIEPNNYDELERGLIGFTEAKYAKYDDQMSGNILKLRENLKVEANNLPKAQRSRTPTVHDGSDPERQKEISKTEKLKINLKTELKEEFNAATLGSDTRQNDSNNPDGCRRNFKREKSLDIDDRDYKEEFEGGEEEELNNDNNSNLNELSSKGDQVLRPRDTHSEEKPVCRQCGKCFGDPRKLKVHEKIHTGERPYKCQYCPITFISIYAQRAHLKRHSDKNPFVCSECGKAFTFSSTFKVHMRTHSEERPYPCLHCSKTFKTTAACRNHMTMHTNEMPYECAECKQGFTSGYKLKVHERIHTGERPYKCRDCTKTFRTNCSFKVHMRAHLNEKPHVCSECGKGFITLGRLTAHRKYHSKNKLYKCRHCSKTFRHSCSFKVHVQAHSVEKTNVCSECGKGFFTVKSLKAHERYHLKEKLQLS